MRGGGLGTVTRYLKKISGWIFSGLLTYEGGGLGTVTRYLKKIQKIYKSKDTPGEF